MGLLIKQHSNQKDIIEPVVKSLISLKEKNMDFTFKSILEELSHQQYTILK